MSVYEHDDQGLRVIGYNQGIYFYDPTRTLQCEVFLRPDNTLSICGASVASGLTQAGADTLYVRLDGNNWASWIPTGGTQSVVGSFNLQGAALQYKITGRHALSMPGTGNLLAGEAAGAALVAGGNDNVLLGYQAGAALTTEDDNVIIGSYAGYTGAHASSVIVGYSAGATDAAESVLNTVLIGPYTWGAGSATDSVLIGASVLAGQDAGDDSTQDVIIGSGAAAGGNYNGYSNVILGYQAGNDVTTGRDNVLVGWRAADTLTEGIGNVIVGSETAYSLLGGNYNVVIGELAGIGLTSGSNNVILGQTAGQALTTATGNVFVGAEAGFGNIGEHNTVVGAYASWTGGTRSYNAIFGYRAGYSLTTGHENVLMGYQAGAALTNTDYGVLIGGKVLSKSTADNSYAVLIGWSIGDSIVTGDFQDSVVIGWEAVYDTPTDMVVNNCVLIGDQVLNTIGASGFATKSIVVGANAIYEGVSTNEDVIIGYSAASAGSYAGEYTVAVGAYTGAELTTGNKNTLVGFGSGVALTTGASNVFLGFQSGYYETGDNKLFIDNAKRTNEADARVKALVYGVFDAATANQHLTFNSHLHYGGGPGYALHQSYSAVDNVGVTVIADAAGDVTATVTFMYAVYAVTGTDSTGGVVTLEPGDSFVLYNDGTDVLTITVSAGGAVTVARTAGADTFNVALQGVWL